MSIEERQRAALRNFSDFKSELEDKADFGDISETSCQNRIQVMHDLVSLVTKLRQHKISWEYLMRHVHTLAPKRKPGSETYDLSDGM